MMTTVSVPCSTPHCGGIALLSKALYEDAADVLRLRCERGHVFEHDKRTSPPKQAEDPPGSAFER